MARYELTETIEQLLGVDIPERNINAQLLCMFHDENTPSFSVNLDTGQFQCFGCGIHGGINKLARMVGGELDEDLRYDILIKSTLIEPQQRHNLAPLANQYLEGAKSGRGRLAINSYLEKRGLPDTVAEYFGLGYDESRDCIALPYWDDSRCTGIKLRARDGSKYSVSDSTYGLYNVDDVRGRPIVIIGEGESDTHQLWSRLLRDREGGHRAPGSGQSEPDDSDGSAERLQVGVCGTSGAVKSERLWQLWSLDLLFARKVYVCYDADDAGDEGFKVAQRYLHDKAIRIRPPKEGDDVTKHFQSGGTLEQLGLADSALHV